MATQTSIPFQDFAVYIGDGQSPTEGFTKVCGLRTRGFSRTSETSQSGLLDCADESLPMATATNVVSKNSELTGSGVAEADDFLLLDDAYESGASTNFRIGSPDPSKFYWQGAFLVTTLTATADKTSEGGRVTFDLTLTSDGDVVRTDVPSS